MPESEKRNICFTYSWNVDNERRRMDANFSEKSLVLFEFTLEDLQPNFKANGDRNQTGYKVSAMEMLDEGKIRPVGNFGVYFRFLYKGIIIKHNKTEPTYTKTSLFLCEKRRFFMARTEKGVVATI